MIVWQSFLCLLLAVLGKAKAELYKPAVPILCSENSHCPLEWPCCSQYGECGAGPMCVGGCNPKFSFSQEDCTPMPALVPPFQLHYLAQVSPVLTQRGHIPSDRTEPQSAPTILSTEAVLNSKNIIHHATYLVTNNLQAADNMLTKFDFTYSGPISIHDNTGDLMLNMPKRSTGSLLSSTRHFLYGKVGVRMKTARSRGVVTAVVLISSTGDEIDFEFLGSELNQVQTNYYSQRELIYNKMQVQPLSTDSWSNYHTYEINWEEDKIEWIVDGIIIRTLFKRDTWDPALQKYKYPQSPMRLEVAIWPGGAETNPPGTIGWAGGLIDWENSPDMINYGNFWAQVQDIKMIPYYNKYVPQMQSCIANNAAHRLVYSYYKNNDRQFLGDNEVSWNCDAVPHVDNWISSYARNPHSISSKFKKMGHKKSKASATGSLIELDLEKDFVPDIRLLEFAPNGTVYYNSSLPANSSNVLTTSDAVSVLSRNPLARLIQLIAHYMNR